jgi:hypothetical protein
MIKMFEQIIAFAAGYTATLFIIMISAMIFLSVFGLRLVFTVNSVS